MEANEIEFESEKTVQKLNETDQRLKCGEIFLDNEKISMDCLICNLTISIKHDEDNSDFVAHIEGHLLNPISVNKSNSVEPKIDSKIKTQQTPEPELFESVFLADECKNELNDTSFDCPVKNCVYSTEIKKDLLIHIYHDHELVQHVDASYECSICGIKYNARNTTNRHLRLKHNYTTKLEPDFMESDEYKCNECEKVYLRLVDYNMHLKSSHEKSFKKLLVDQQEQFDSIGKVFTDNTNYQSKIIRPPPHNNYEKLKALDEANYVQSENQMKKIPYVDECINFIPVPENNNEFLKALNETNSIQFENLKKKSEKQIKKIPECMKSQKEIILDNSENKNINHIFKCLLKNCLASSKSKKDLYIHILEKHDLMLHIDDHWQCEICDVKYNTHSSLVMHLQRDHGIVLTLKFSIENDLYKCCQCNNDYKTNLLLNCHLKEQHFKYFNESLAKEILQLQKLINIKNKSRDNRFLQKNGNSTESFELIEQLENSPIDFLDEKMELWEIDGKEGSEKMIEENIECNEYAELNKNFYCLIKTCQYCSDSKIQLYIHLLSTHSLVLNVGNRYECAICDINYNQRTSLIRHLNQYHGISLNLKLKIKNDVFNCFQCSEDFKTSVMLNSHLKKEHLNYYYESLAKELIKREDSRNKESEICKIPKLKNHVNKLELHSLQKLIVKLDNGLWKCLHCNETKDKRTNMRVHVRNHFDRKMCEICGKLTKPKKYIFHMRTHTGEKPHQCEYCEKKFANYTNFRNHVRTHTGDKRHKCDFCDQRFIQRTSKMTHMRVIHLKIQPYQCDICGKKLSTAGQLKTHILRNHTYEKPFECDICNKKFGANYLLTHHKLLHSNPTPFECNICDAKYALKSSLRMHKRKKHLHR